MSLKTAQPNYTAAASKSLEQARFAHKHNPYQEMWTLLVDWRIGMVISEPCPSPGWRPENILLEQGELPIPLTSPGQLGDIHYLLNRGILNLNWQESFGHKTQYCCRLVKESGIEKIATINGIPRIVLNSDGDSRLAALINDFTTAGIDELVELADYEMEDLWEDYCWRGDSKVLFGV